MYLNRYLFYTNYQKQRSAMEKPTKILSDEHVLILKIADALNNECDAIENGKIIDGAFFEKAVDFIRNYADKFHHAKEEDILFKELCKEGVLTHCNPVEQMLYEHDTGRGFVKNMEKAVRESNKSKIIENARNYANLLKDHIFKEDNILYPMADQSLDKNKQKSVLDKFKDAENKRFAKGTKKKYIVIAEEFEKRK